MKLDIPENGCIKITNNNDGSHKIEYHLDDIELAGTKDYIKILNMNVKLDRCIVSVDVEDIMIN